MLSSNQLAGANPASAGQEFYCRLAGPLSSQQYGGNTFELDMIMQRAVFTSEDFDVERVAQDTVRYAIILRLPFRFRTGPLFRYLSADGEAEIWLRNATDIPQGADFGELIRSRSGTYGSWTDLWTEASVMLRHPSIPDEDLDSLSGSTVENLSLTSNIFAAQDPLNELIIAYSEATGLTHGGNLLRTLTDIEFIAHARLEITFLCPSEYLLTADDALELFEWTPEKTFVTTQVTGSMDDLPTELLEELPEYGARIRDHAFYELGFEARSEIGARRPAVGLVLACAALEGAHAAYLRNCLEEPLSEYRGSRSLINEMLRKQGIYTGIQLTVNVWMPDQFRPSSEDLETCLQGIQMRNDIMHVKDKLRQHSVMDFSDAWRGVNKVYKSFLNALAAG